MKLVIEEFTVSKFSRIKISNTILRQKISNSLEIVLNVSDKYGQIKAKDKINSLSLKAFESLLHV